MLVTHLHLPRTAIGILRDSFYLVTFGSESKCDTNCKFDLSSYHISRYTEPIKKIENSLNLLIRAIILKKIKKFVQYIFNNKKQHIIFGIQKFSL